jgi:hypothetical protein
MSGIQTRYVGIRTTGPIDRTVTVTGETYSSVFYITTNGAGKEALHMLSQDSIFTRTTGSLKTALKWRLMDLESNASPFSEQMKREYITFTFFYLQGGKYEIH